MNKLVLAGRAMFALGFLELSISCFIAKDFIIGRPPAWPAGIEPNPALAYVSGGLLFLCAMAVLLRFRGKQAALLIAALIFLLSFLRELPLIMQSYLNAYKTLALIGGALITAASFMPADEALPASRLRGMNTRKGLLIAGSVMAAIFFISGGYSHFKFADFVIGFIPDYIPAHPFFTYFCGICLIAGGIGLILPMTRYWAALLSGVMILGWFLLLHIPRFLANTSDASDRMGLGESLALAGVMFVLAGCLRKEKMAASPMTWIPNRN